MQNISNKQILILGAILALISALVYIPMLDNGFVDFDNESYIYENPYMDLPLAEFAPWAFTSFYQYNWQPLTWLSLRLDYSLWGFEPKGFFITNILLHSTNVFLVVLLLFSLLKRVPGFLEKYSPPSVLAGITLIGIVFAIHPLQVETVAWGAERKNLIYSLFWLLSLLSYLTYTKRESWKTYILCFVLFMLSLLGKPMAVTLPAVLLLLDYYPLRRQRNIKLILLEKIPFFALSASSALIAIIAQKAGGALVETASLPMADRFWIATHALAFYLYKIILPTVLVPFYALPETISPMSIKYAGSLLIVAGGIALGIRLRKSYPVIITAILYFGITLSPTLGIIQVGAQSAADRYIYLSILGPLILAAWGMIVISDKGRNALITVCALMAILSVGMYMKTTEQIKVWNNSMGFWNYIVEHQPQSARGYLRRAFLLVEAGRTQEAIHDYSMIITINERSPKLLFAPLHILHAARGSAFMDLNKYSDAIVDYNKALELEPSVSEYYFNRGISKKKTGLNNEAILDFNNAIFINPMYAEAYNSLGTTLFITGDALGAIDALSRALVLSPDKASYYFNRGKVREYLKQDHLAQQDFRYAENILQRTTDTQ